MATLNVTLQVWRQDGPDAAGSLRDLRGARHQRRHVVPRDARHRQRAAERATGQEPITFDHDCREGICGTCSLMINGQAHGPQRGTATCQLHMRKFADGDTITIEPWRAARLPGHQGPDGRPRRPSTASSRPAASSPRRPAARPTPTSSSSRRSVADASMDAARASAAAPAWPPARTAPPTCSPRPRSPTSTCCPRASPSATAASRRWSTRWRTYFGSCTNHGECEAACPKSISIDFIALMNRDYLKAKFKNRRLLLART